MALAGVELETLVFEPDAQTIQKRVDASNIEKKHQSATQKFNINKTTKSNRRRHQAKQTASCMYHCVFKHTLVEKVELCPSYDECHQSVMI